MDNYERTTMMVTASKLYYEFDYNQGMIAAKLGISRPFVSKLLAEAREAGIVKIKIVDPTHTENRMEREIRQRYELRRVIVVPSKVDTDARVKICTACGQYLNGIIKSGDVIAVGSGQTLNLSSKCLIKREDLSGIKVVTLEGSLCNNQHSTYQQDTAKRYADSLGGIPYVLPLPIFFSHPEILNQIKTEPNISKTYRLMERANIAIFTVSNVGTGKSMGFVRDGYFTDEEMKEFIQNGAVSNLLFNFLNKAGQICEPTIAAMNTSLPVVLLKQKEYRMCLAAGREKIDSVVATLNGGYANVLIIDENIAEGILS